MIAEGLHEPARRAARIGDMLSEEALIVLAAVGAVGLLVLGVLELLWPTKPRHPVRQRTSETPRAARPHRQSALVRHARERGREPYARRQPAPTSAPAPPALPPRPPLLTSPPPSPAPLVASLPPPEPETLPGVAPGLAPAEAEAPAVADFLESSSDEVVVETCFALYQEQRYSEVIERAADALTAGPDGRPLTDAQEKAALWSVVALARQALGEDAGARGALESAIAVALDADRPTYQRQLASLAESVAQGLLAEAQRHARQDSEECLAAIRSAVAWLDRGVAATPSDARLTELAAGAQAQLWPAWERTVVALAQRQEFRVARRLLREALADPRFPAGRADAFRELFSGTFSGEIGQLTAQAIRSMQEARESDALAALHRAETLLGTLNDDALSPSRREEVDRRLWWGYNRLGNRRVDAGEHEAALEPLLHALGYEVGPERRQETIALLVRALHGVVDTRALAIRELADAGDREAALVQCDRLWARLRGTGEQGAPEAALTAVLNKVQKLFETLGRPPG
jgi:tetratricopeptide (TPR) repeat protein